MNLLGNNIRGTLESGINTEETAMSVVLDGKQQSLSRHTVNETPMYLTISNDDDPLLCEIVQVTATTGAIVNTMVRAQRGTSALVWPTGSIVSLNMHAQDVNVMYPFGVHEILSKPAPLTVTVPDNASLVNVEFTADNDTMVLALPLGEINQGKIIAVVAAITADAGTATALDIVLGTNFGTESGVANGAYIYLCIAPGEWVPLHAVYATTPIAGVTLGAAAGAEATPSLTFGDATTGFYRSAADEISASVSASNVATLSAAGLDVVGAISGDTLDISGMTVNTDGDIAGVDVTATGVVTAAAGTVGAPSVTLGDSTTGLYRSAANEIATAVSGVNVVTVDSDGLEVAGSLDVEAVTATGVITATAGTVGAPSVTLGDSTTGLYRSAANEVALAVSGAQKFKFTATALLVPAGSPGACAINFGTAGTGVYGSSTTVDIATAGSNRATIDSSGLAVAGIITATSSGASSSFRCNTYRNSGTQSSYYLYNARGTSTTPANLQSGDENGALIFRAWQTGTTFTSNGLIRYITTEAHSATALGCKCQIYTTANTTTTLSPALTLDNDKTMTTYADEIMASTAYKYFGASGTNGSWRIGRSGDNLVFERREAGSWVTKLTVED